MTVSKHAKLTSKCRQAGNRIVGKGTGSVDHFFSDLISTDAVVICIIN